MPLSEKCPRCGEAIPEGVPEGVCPSCLVRVAVELGKTPTQKSGTFVPPDTAELNRHFPDLDVIALIGCGGMGAVYLARQKQLERTVALKILPPHRAADPTFAERFAREARALAKLDHVNIIRVFDAGQADAFLFIVMEYVDGASLRDLLLGGRLSPSDAMRLVPQICDAIQYAHDHGVIHRDIKPENILIDQQGRVKVADFGLAKLSHSKEPSTFTLTDAGDRMGTPRYMAPEQFAASAQVDHRVDIYSLGVMFYEMLTGELPMVDYKPPSAKTEVDPRLDRVVERSIKSSPDERYQKAAEVKHDLERIVATPAQRLSHSLLWLGGLMMLGMLAYVCAQFPLRRETGDVKATPSRVEETAERRPAAPLTPSRQPQVVSSDGNYALEFGGATSYVAIPSLRRDEPGPLTLEAWVRPDLPRFSQVVFVVGGKYRCELAVKPTGWFVWDESLKGLSIEPKTGLLAGPPTRLVHVAYTVDDQEGRLYVDGVEIGRASVDSTTERPTQVAHAWFGGHSDQSNAAVRYLYHGLIDEARVSDMVRYTKAFTPAPRFELDAHTLALYHFDEGFESVLIDASGHGHDGKIVGASWVPAGADLSSAKRTWTPLFNGHDRAGWDRIEGQPTWNVVDGVLTGKGKAGNLGRLHYTQRTYANYHLRAEIRLLGPGNSGFDLWWARETGPQGYHVEAEPTRSGALALHVPFAWINNPAHALPDNQTWFTLEIIANGPKVVTKVNDTPVSTFDESTHSRTSISLELDSRLGDTTVEFRKVEILDLDLPE